MYWNKRFDWALKMWWDNRWRQNHVYYNLKGQGNEDVRSVLYVSPSDKSLVDDVVRSCSRFYYDADGNQLDELDEDSTFKSIQRWVKRNVTYMYDKQQYGRVEYWADAGKTLRSRKGDCDDHAILIKVLCLFAGIPDYRLKVAAGYVKDWRGQTFGHAYLLYLWRKNNVWTREEGTWSGGGYQNIWFTFNREFSWAQKSLSFDRKSFRKKIRGSL